LSSQPVPGAFEGDVPKAHRKVDVLSRRVEDMLLQGGCLAVEVWEVGECGVIAAREPMGGGRYAWHVSISHDTRYPTWDEIKVAVYMPGATWAPQPGKMYAQLLGPVDDGEWVNVHENCFHLYEIADPLEH
jgi:hypothetical protein